MREMNQFFGLVRRGAALAVATLAVGAAQGATPGIVGTGGGSAPAFDLIAKDGYVSQPDGASVYTWGYGCNSQPGAFVPAGIPGTCPNGEMQLPGPTLVVNQGDTVSVTLKNSLPPAAGNTSILFPGFAVSASATTGSTGACTSPVSGVLTTEAANGCAVTYTFVAATAGTHSYYSGTQGDLQVEMGLYGALIVLPSKVVGNTITPLNGAVPTLYTTPAANLPDTCHALTPALTLPNGAQDFRLAAAAFDHPGACYDREYLFQMSEMDPRIHAEALAQVTSLGACTAGTSGCSLQVPTEPYHPAYFLLNGRSMPDDMDPNYAPQYPRQPYNSNPHMHPGELTLVRVIGQGRMQHPFHEHANHVRVLARDGYLLLTAGNNLAGPLLFTTSTVPGQTLDGIFQFTAKGLNWDVYGHSSTAGAGDKYATNAADPIYGSYNGTPVPPCKPDANGYYTTGSGAPVTAPNYFEWCADHQLALEAKPFGQVGSGGPVTLPDPNVLVNGAWYSGSPYLGPDAAARSVGPTPIPPFGTIANDPGAEAGFAYMWHSHNEREITTNNIFPGGMMTMMLVDPWVFFINEAN